MLRRYLIVNGTSTALLYGAIYAAVPSTAFLTDTVRGLYEGYVMQSPILGPLFNKVVMLMSSL